jgi:hypothetical protein
MKHSPLKRRSPLSPRTSGDRKPLKRVNRKRRASEFARCYGSKERVEWVKRQPCIDCGATPSDNAHVEGEGVGRKAHHTRIVPLCRTHHRAYDEHREPFDRPEMREEVGDLAAWVESRWQHHQSARLTPEER